MGEIILHCIGETNTHAVVVPTVIRDAENADRLQRTDIQLKHLLQPKKERFFLFNLAKGRSSDYLLLGIKTSANRELQVLKDCSRGKT